MIQTKYLIIIGVVVCLLVLYYFYSEISTVKKLFLPTYQKTMELDAKILNLEKKTNQNISTNKLSHKNNSPAMTISYQSDMVKNGNLSVRYADLSDTAAKELLIDIDQHKNSYQNQNYNHIQSQNRSHDQNYNKNRSNDQNYNKNRSHDQNLIEKKKCVVQNGEFSDFLPASPIKGRNDLINTPMRNKRSEESDTINFRIADLIKKNQDTFSTTNTNLPNNSDHAEYQKILNGLNKSISNIQTDNMFDNDSDIDSDLLHNISESIRYADIPSDTILSDAPNINATKKKGAHRKTSIKTIPLKKSYNKTK